MPLAELLLPEFDGEMAATRRVLERVPSWEQAVSGLLRALRLDSIRSKMLVFALLATLIPSVTTGWISYLQNERSLTAKITGELQSVSAQTAREIDLWVKERLYELRVFASSYEVSENLDRIRHAGGERAHERLTGYLPAVRGLLEREGATREYRGLEGQEVVGAAKRVPRPDWAVLAEVPAAEAYRQVTRLRNVTAVIVAALLVAVGLFAYFLGLLITRPLDRLTGAATKVAGGDLAVHLPVVGGGELGYVTEVFNDMVARLHESRRELERLSVTDDLTGLYNRRYLMDALANEMRRSRRLDHPCALLMADVDHFKEYNDAYGHLAGDEALRRIAGILRDTTRDVDCAARYGGEEFVVLLPETRAAGAIETAQRFRASLATDELVGGKLSVSIGVAQFPEDGDAPEGLLARADAALYRAKREGRDRVLRAAPPAPPPTL